MVVLRVLAIAVACAYAAVPLVPLKNAAQPGVAMPATGLGTGAYTTEWRSNSSELAADVATWLKMGGMRIDTSWTYEDQPAVAAGIKQSGLDRKDIFVTSKVGPWASLGYNETLAQFEVVLQTLDLDYVDLLLIHWPAGGWTNSTDVACAPATLNPRVCRQNTWRAMEKIFASGRARAIGVSNFEINHLEDILDLHGLVPSVNQYEYHPYWHNDQLREFCQHKNILVNGYAPLGTPDRSPTCCNYSLPTDPAIQAIAQKHNVSAAQVILAWEVSNGLVVNPRTKNPDHMKENIDFFDITLTKDEAETLAKMKPSADQTPNICPDPSKMK